MMEILEHVFMVAEIMHYQIQSRMITSRLKK